MTNFTPLTGLIGGALIGLAATLLILINGRIAGISGIVGGVLGGSGGEARWRGAFLAGLVVGPFVVAAVRGSLPEISLQASWPMLIVAGLLVGFGTRLGSGCTSGHGVCGIARGSPRSMWATFLFFTVAVVTVFVVRHVVGG